MMCALSGRFALCCTIVHHYSCPSIPWDVQPEKMRYFIRLLGAASLRALTVPAMILVTTYNDAPACKNTATIFRFLICFRMLHADFGFVGEQGG